MKNLDEYIIGRNNDGFTVSLLTPKDFSSLLDLTENLSDEQKLNYHRPVFMRHTSLAAKFLRIFMKLSLRPFTGKIIKKIVPRFYFAIVKCESLDNQFVGFYSLFKFKKLADGKYSAYATIAITKQFQGKGLSFFIVKNCHEHFKKKGLSKIISNVRPTNSIQKKVYKKLGSRYVKTIKNATKYKNKLYDSEIWITDLDD